MSTQYEMPLYRGSMKKWLDEFAISYPDDEDLTEAFWHEWRKKRHGEFGARTRSDAKKLIRCWRQTKILQRVNDKDQARGIRAGSNA